ncbi:SRPBCC family protein [Nitrosomonas supralitoralis]|uniref:Polyketide cyclase n=1 Tax=Nitrosomonas supralitoralis TaxID=2116706 RepID=A0A2P7NR05_9PROT|nr:SRPBCC family protein [Nitrosomonas supralitoralis]PSJ15911.1 polyketide cyclase [Nitrosomonas supralitoralis]
MTTEFKFVTEWRIDAPLVEVCDTIIHCLDWPIWWKNVKMVEKIENGDADGIGSVHRFTWKGRIPYRFTFDMRVTGFVPLSLLEGHALGEITGTGRWNFFREDELTVVRYHWHIYTNRRWMNLLAPIASPVFKWNHHQVMWQGAKGMACQLNARLEYFHTSTE